MLYVPNQQNGGGTLTFIGDKYFANNAKFAAAEIGGQTVGVATLNGREKFFQPGSVTEIVYVGGRTTDTVEIKSEAADLGLQKVRANLGRGFDNFASSSPCVQVTVLGGAHNDLIVVYGNGSVMKGNGGHDRIDFFGSDGQLYGDAGNDQLRAVRSGNYLEGKSGRDILETIIGQLAWDQVGRANTVNPGSGKDKLIVDPFDVQLGKIGSRWGDIVIYVTATPVSQPIPQPYPEPQQPLPGPTVTDYIDPQTGDATYGAATIRLHLQGTSPLGLVLYSVEANGVFLANQRQANGTRITADVANPTTDFAVFDPFGLLPTLQLTTQLVVI
jgi:hypothetical protein